MVAVERSAGTRVSRPIGRARAGAAPLALVLALLAGVCGPVASLPAGAASTRRAGSVDAAVAAEHPGATAATPTDGVPVDRSRFEPHACVAFASTKGNVHHTVFIDAGHGSIDPGGGGVTETGETIYEAPSDLAIELATMRLLRAKGFQVVVSRTTATEVSRLSPTDLTGTVLSVQGARADIAARDECADLAGATLLVGIYLDAETTPQDAGCLTAYDATRPFAAENERIASLLQADVMAHLNANGWQIPDDGAQPDTTLGGQPLTTTAAAYHHLLLLGPKVTGWFTTPSQMPGALIEPLFISDPFEGSIAVSSAGRTAIARGMAEAIEQYFSRRSSGA